MRRGGWTPVGTPVAGVLGMLAAVSSASAQPPKGYLTIQSGNVDLSGPLKWIVILAVLGGLAHLSWWLWSTKRKQLLRRRASAQTKAERSAAFQERASHLGFRAGEAKTVERIAVRLAPKSPLNLLNSGNGREYLLADMDRRIARRQREVQVLERIKERLTALREGDVHERESVRVEANTSVWVSKRGLSTQEMAALVDDEDEAEGEGLFGNLDSVQGRLVDISEGGAALAVEMDVNRGDQITFWSADPNIVLGETRSGVVSSEQRDGERILHVHFIDPDLRDVRGAILQLRGEDLADEET